MGQIIEVSPMGWD
ncbi:unnamed protein product, partial [Rotaria magnacalcarata]